MSGSRPKQFLFPYVCPRCKKVVNRLGAHLKSCRVSDKPANECRKEAKQMAAHLLRNSVINKRDLKRISNISDSKERYEQLKLHYERLGHVLISDDEGQTSDNDNSSHEGSDIEDLISEQPLENASDVRVSEGIDQPEAARPPMRKRKHQRRRVYIEDSKDEVESDDDGLEEALSSAEQPKICDPRIFSKYKKGSLGDKVRKAGLYRRFTKITLLIRFSRKRIRDLRSPSIVKQYTVLCSRILAFIFRKENVAVSRVEDFELVARLLTNKNVKRFKRAMENLGMSGSGIRSIERAALSLMEFLYFDFELSAESQASLKRSIECLKHACARTKRKIARERRAKRKDRYEQRLAHASSISNYRSLFRTERVESMLSEARDRLMSEMQKEDFIFLTWYCVAKLCLYYAHRPSVAKNLTVKELLDKDEYENDASKVCIHIAEHKTSSSRGVQQVVLDTDDWELFEFYLRKCRQVLSPIPEDGLANSNENLFITYRNKRSISNPTKMVQAFQEHVGAERHTATDARHTFETEAHERLRQEPAARAAVSELLGHTSRIAFEVYTDQRPQQVMPGAVAIEQLDNKPTISRLSASAPRVRVSAAGLSEAQMDYLISAYLKEGEHSMFPGPTSLERDTDLMTGDVSDKPALARTAYSFLRNRLQRMRINFMARKVTEEVFSAHAHPGEANNDQAGTGVPDILFSHLDKVQQVDWKQKLCASARKVAKEQNWGSFEFEKRVFPSIVIVFEQKQLDRKREQAMQINIRTQLAEEAVQRPQVSEDQEANFEHEFSQMSTQRLHDQHQPLVREQSDEVFDANAQRRGEMPNRWELNRELSGSQMQPMHQRKSIVHERQVSPESSQQLSPTQRLSDFRIHDVEGNSSVLQHDDQQAGQAYQDEQDEETVADAQVVSVQASDDHQQPTHSQAHERSIIYVSRVYVESEIALFIEKQTWPGLIVKDTMSARGGGLFIDEGYSFGKGQVICDYNGELMLEAEHSAKLEKMPEGPEKELIKAYRLEITGEGGAKYMIESHNKNGSYGRFANHSQVHPNVEPRLKTISVGNRVKNVVLFYAKRKLKPGQELLWDYGKMWEGADWYRDCPCPLLRCVEALRRKEASGGSI